ncbi:hypothetical protein HG535_0G04930 [Zygotorulaspora mrakii]|uniref:Transcriptional activator HAP2 n=1 Tax=Zygotorulaspora mrakii TaxID=42260 RepID=A0A7H9B7U3_ZYGMR|nr:uncharacterized protein HG535_0G04930 [Zygotorulaspora mrakii]QLG74610.1 hypothetical protein HG535_0G04930 [Zygotorulaspora mrakii]
MNRNEENYHPIDAGLVGYPTDELQLTSMPGPFNERDARERASKGEPNPTDIYLYDHPQDGERQDTENASISHYDGNREDEPAGTENKRQKTQEGKNSTSSSQLPLGSSSEVGLTSEIKSGRNSANNSYIESVADSLASMANTELSIDPVAGGSTSEVNEVAEQPFYVNAKQYYRILKRRYARAKLEENLRISRERKPYLHESRHKHAMRRPRGQGGRFLTLAEIEELKNKEGSQSSTPSATDTPGVGIEDEKKYGTETKTTAPIQQESDKNKLACIKKK